MGLLDTGVLIEGRGGLFQNNSVEEGLKPLLYGSIEDREVPPKRGLTRHLKRITGQRSLRFSILKETPTPQFPYHG